MTKISEIVFNEIESFKYKDVMLTEGYGFNQYKTIRRINRYLGNKFMNCPDPDAMFWNLSLSRIPMYAKSIDMNSKDFYVFGVSETSSFQAWILNVRFKKWVQEDRFALTLDAVSNGVATYGSAVWKKFEKEDGEVGIEEADLRNLYFDPTVKDIIDTPVVEMHYMTETQLRAKWPDKVDEIVEKAKKARDQENHEAESADDKYEVWERWGEYKEEEQDDAIYMHFIGVGQGDHETILVEDEIKVKDGKPAEFPYYDFHGERMQGRWMGRGVVERLFELQEQINTLVNQNNEANQIASLLLFRTADPNTTGNILQSAISGQIINTADMQQMGIDNRFIATFLNQLQSIESKADELCYINESISGETPPSGVPFRSLAVATRAAKSTFKFLKTSIGEKMGYILEEQVMPSLVKKFNKEDIIEINEDENDIRRYDSRMADETARQFKLEKVQNGEVIFEEDIIAVRAQALKSLEENRRIEKIGKKFFNFDYGIMMNPTGESMDKATMNAALDGALEMMLAAPAIVNTPLFKKKLELNGIPSFRLTPGEEAQLVQSGAGSGAPIPEAEGVDKLSQLAEAE